MAVALPITAAHAEREWYFFVQNGTNANITKLEVSPDNATWGIFEIGSGLEAGSTAKLVWAPNTNDEPCQQWMRATFADGTLSQPYQGEFCSNLDEPIVFTE